MGGQSAWHVCLHPRPSADWRLVCFAHAGAGPGAFLAWPRLLPERIEAHAVLLPGHGRRLRETPETSVEQLITSLAPALQRLADRPIAFFGHSLGALLAFEVARAWRRAGGRQPAHLFLSGSHAPHVPRERPAISAAPDADFLAAVHELGGTPPEVLAQPALLDLLLPALRADFALAEGYQYQTDLPLDVPFTVMGGADDRRAPPEGLAAWAGHTCQAFEVQVFPGDHFYLDPQRPAVVAEIARQLVEARPARLPKPAALA